MRWLVRLAAPGSLGLSALPHPACVVRNTSRGSLTRVATVRGRGACGMHVVATAAGELGCRAGSCVPCAGDYAAVVTDLGDWPVAPALDGLRLRLKPLRVEHAQEMAVPGALRGSTATSFAFDRCLLGLAVARSLSRAWDTGPSTGQAPSNKRHGRRATRGRHRAAAQAHRLNAGHVAGPHSRIPAIGRGCSVRRVSSLR